MRHQTDVCIARTYVAQIVNNIEELWRLFIVVAQLVNSFFDDKILGDLGPHVLFLPCATHG